MNYVVISGNLGADPQVYSGGKVVRLDIANHKRVKQGEEYVDGVQWFTVKVFGKTAERASQYLKKGMGVNVEGRLTVDDWTDEEGIKHTAVRIVCFGFEITRWPKREGEEVSEKLPQIPSMNQGEGEEFDDLPF